MLRQTFWAAVLGALLGGGGIAHAQSCGDLVSDAGGYGPFDYRDPTARAEKLPIVEGAHFTREVELLERGNRSGANPGGDIDYTLRKFPNHHRALAAMARLFVRHEGDRPHGVRYPMSCWFQKARQFAAGDGMVVMIEGIYLQEMGNPARALGKLEEAAQMEPNNPNIRYNLGLAYARQGALDKAVEQAKAAYGAGFPLPGLRNMLAAKGAWPPAGE